MTAPIIFNRRLLKQRRLRAAAGFAGHDFLLEAMIERLGERLDDVTRSFPHALNLTMHDTRLVDRLAGRGGVKRWVSAGQSGQVICDEEWLPFAENSFDLVACAAVLHWVNDLPGVLAQIRRILKPDGLFLAIFPGGESLQELRESLEKAEMELRGGVSPRISPFIDVRSGGMLLQRAGFALPVADGERLDVLYEHPLKLMKELRGMGEANAHVQSHKGFTPCSVIMQAADYYMRDYADDDGRIKAHFDLVTLTGWKPHPSQAQPAKRGSGMVNLNDTLKD